MTECLLIYGKPWNAFEELRTPKAVKRKLQTAENHRMFWNGQKIVDLNRAFLDTSGCAKKQDAKISVYKEIKSNFIEFNEENFYKILADKNVASQKGLVEMFDSQEQLQLRFLFGGKYQTTELKVVYKLYRFSMENVEQFLSQVGVLMQKFPSKILC